jgi:hypothetical protein
MMKKKFDSVEMMRSIRNSIHEELRNKSFDESGELARIRKKYRIHKSRAPLKVAEQSGEYGSEAKPPC